jgi:hypothetical protein
MAANSPENPVPMITVSTWRGCIGLPAYADISFVADCSDALIFRLVLTVGCRCSGGRRAALVLVPKCRREPPSKSGAIT